MMFGLRKSFGAVARMATNNNVFQQRGVLLQMQRQNGVRFSFAETVQHSKENQRKEGSRHEEVSGQILHKLIKALTSAHIKLDAQIIRVFVEGLQQRGLPQSIFSSVVSLLVTRQNAGELQGVDRLELLKQMALALETRIKDQSYELIEKTNDLSRWILETNQKVRTNDQQLFELAVFSLTTGDVQVFGKNLILLKDQEKIIQSLLYLEQCPQIYRDSVVAYLKTLPLTADLRSRLAEFTGVSTDPTSYDTS